jgi:hypothetical protein
LLSIESQSRVSGRESWRGERSIIKLSLRYSSCKLGGKQPFRGERSTKRLSDRFKTVKFPEKLSLRGEMFSIRLPDKFNSHRISGKQPLNGDRSTTRFPDKESAHNEEPGNNFRRRERSTIKLSSKYTDLLHFPELIRGEQLKGPRFDDWLNPLLKIQAAGSRVWDERTFCVIQYSVVLFFRSGPHLCVSPTQHTNPHIF